MELKSGKQDKFLVILGVSCFYRFHQYAMFNFSFFGGQFCLFTVNPKLQVGVFCDAAKRGP